MAASDTISILGSGRGHARPPARRGPRLSPNCPRQERTPRIQEHSSYFSVSGELTENAETLGKTPTGDRRRAELKILWSLAPCGFDPRPRHFIFNHLRAWSGCEAANQCGPTEGLK
jgi:hypothetical protein